MRGNYAIWGAYTRGPQPLYERDLTAETTTQISSGAGNICHDVAPNGDVVFGATTIASTDITRG